MAIKVNPTRMELRRLKNKQKTAVRGHKLLKDKSDEMIRQFMGYARENKRLRIEVERELKESLSAFMLAKAVSDSAIIEEAVAMPSASVKVKTEARNIMNVNVPKLVFDIDANADKYPYSFLTTTSELDDSIARLTEVTEKLIKLAEVEKACNMLAREIERNKRRVNALEYVMIPENAAAIKEITMKLDENERGNIVRLMKVKTMIANRE